MDSQSKAIFNKEISRITKEISPDIIIIFHNEVGDKPYLSYDVRQNILNRWANKYPSIKPGNWRTYLSRLEHKFLEEQPQISQKALINRMTAQHDGLVDRILTESEEDITKQSKAIKDLNELTAKIHRLTDAPAAVNIIFESSVNEDELTRSIVDSFKKNDAFDVESSSVELPLKSNNNRFDVDSTNKDRFDAESSPLSSEKEV